MAYFKMGSRVRNLGLPPEDNRSNGLTEDIECTVYIQGEGGPNITVQYVINYCRGLVWRMTVSVSVIL